MSWCVAGLLPERIGVEELYAEPVQPDRRRTNRAASRGLWLHVTMATPRHLMTSFTPWCHWRLYWWAIALAPFESCVVAFCMIFFFCFFFLSGVGGGFGFIMERHEEMVKSNWYLPTTTKKCLATGGKTPCSTFFMQVKLLRAVLILLVLKHFGVW